MKKISGELCIYPIILIIVGSYYLCIKNYDLFLFWKELIDNAILLILLIFMLLNSSKWHMYSKRLLWSLIFILLVNSYTRLFGMPLLDYLEWYFLPLIITTNIMVITIVCEITYKLYILWKNGKIKLF